MGLGPQHHRRRFLRNAAGAQTQEWQRRNDPPYAGQIDRLCRNMTAAAIAETLGPLPGGTGTDFLFHRPTPTAPSIEPC
jgi:hypothetical protein